LDLNASSFLVNGLGTALAWKLNNLLLEAACGASLNVKRTKKFAKSSLVVLPPRPDF
jgi:hypothetical protein